MNDFKHEAASTEEQYGSPTYAWYVVIILLFAYVTSFLDRTILTLLVEPIRESLNITDLQLSLLHGFAFAVFYVSLGVPIARFADSHNRVKLISAGVLVWSVMTAVCGLARNFTHMFLARVGVGIGEATLSPAAYSIISDYFPVEKRPRAFSVYQTGIYVGMGLAMIIGGYVIAVVPSINMPFYGPMEPWQVVFLLVGLPGLLVISARRGAYGYVIGGVAAKSLAFYGVAAWLPTYFMRTFGWDAQTIGLWYGLASIIFGVIGINTGSTVSVWLRNRGYSDANLRICLGAEACLIPIGILASLMPTPELSMLFYCGFIFFASFSVGCQAAALQEITPNQLRAQVSAIYLFCTNMVGIGFGPTFIAFFTDVVFKNDALVGYSMSIAVAFACPIGVFLFWRGLKPYRKCLDLAKQNYAAPS